MLAIKSITVHLDNIIAITKLLALGVTEHNLLGQCNIGYKKLLTLAVT